MFGGVFGALGGGFFDQNFRAYPVAFIEKDSAEKGDKVILPPSSLNTLASMHVEYPMLFRVENKRGQRVSHCGVLEFVAQEGVVYMPQWMMDNLLLSVGDLVNMKNVSLPKGSFIKIQPHTTNFIDISNPKAVLETCLRNFTCLTQGDTIVIPYNDENYYIDILEVKPDTAVSVVETDVEVDFAPPKDYKEAVNNPPPPSGQQGLPAGSSSEKSSAAGSASAVEKEPEPRFTAFSGSGKRIDGKSATSCTATPVADSSRSCQGSQAMPSAGSSGEGGLKSGKVVFGKSGEDSKSGAAAASPGIQGNRLAARLEKKSTADGKPPTVTPPKVEDEAENPKFVAFGGKGRSLRD